EVELSGGKVDRPILHASRYSLYLNPERCLAARIAFEQVESRVTRGHGLRTPIPKYMIDSIMNAAFHTLTARDRPPGTRGPLARLIKIDQGYQSVTVACRAQVTRQS